MQKKLQILEESLLTSCGVKMSERVRGQRYLPKSKKLDSSVAKKNAEKSSLLKDLGSRKDDSAKIKITLVRSTIGRKPNQVKTVKALGLRKLNSVVEKDVNPAILGMVNTVSHLIEVEEIS